MTTVDHSIQHPGSKTKGDDSFVRFHLGKNKGIGWGVMRCEATRKIIKATFRASNGKMVVLALSRLGLTRNSQQRSECGSREQRWPLRCFASPEPLLSPNTLMHACFAQYISSTCSGSVNISRVAYAIHFDFWVRDTTIWLG